ncbi:MAG: chemotaxis protein CheB [candidate division Zixibacteria bacterium]|nr:chemotaxis protein CheB [candidate division Zixibacteria bacterium]NIR67354.1 chemotaxis protein CheB [candidate division Zixibacteria bacterium]NIS16231.1 chemotaxis protein CheB [candidate division Zixibacteria bacterium]NIS48730.1 chemotaxis protein CheB [candidate division Zixibacteria bacterium]NIT52623.1 chemotaxis protein CheB [candidate division Zixibacteria bacterium]
MDNKIVILAASLGGPPLINDILSGLNPSFDFPIFVLQQMESDFSEPLTQAWSKTSGLRLVRLSGEADIVSGSAYVIPYAAYPVISFQGQGFNAHCESLEKGQDVINQWQHAIEECSREYEVILVLLSHDGLDIAQLNQSLQSLRDAEGQIIRCCTSNKNEANPSRDSDDFGWLEMGIHQVVDYLNKISRSKFAPARGDSGH